MINDEDTKQAKVIGLNHSSRKVCNEDAEQRK